MDASKVSSRIIAAFGSALRPSREEIAGYHHGPECDRLAEQLSPYGLEAVPDTVVDLLYEGLPLLSPQAFRYYLPAYLLYSLKHPESRVWEMTVFNLSPLDWEEPRWKERYVLFSPEQRAAVMFFLEFARSQDKEHMYSEEFGRAGRVWGIEA